MPTKFWIRSSVNVNTIIVILQIEPMECEKIVAAVQAEQEGVGLFRVGDDERGNFSCLTHSGSIGGSS